MTTILAPLVPYAVAAAGTALFVVVMAGCQWIAERIERWQ